MKSGVSCSLARRLVDRGLDVVVLVLPGVTVALRSRVALLEEEVVVPPYGAQVVCVNSE